jgi:hypothetical protein
VLSRRSGDGGSNPMEMTKGLTAFSIIVSGFFV